MDVLLVTETGGSQGQRRVLVVMKRGPGDLQAPVSQAVALPHQEEGYCDLSGNPSQLSGRSLTKTQTLSVLFTLGLGWVLLSYWRTEDPGTGGWREEVFPAFEETVTGSQQQRTVSSIEGIEWSTQICVLWEVTRSDTSSSLHRYHVTCLSHQCQCSVSR